MVAEREGVADCDPSMLSLSTRLIPVIVVGVANCRKSRKSIYIAPFINYVYLKALSHGSHSFTCKYTMPAFPS